MRTTNKCNFFILGRLFQSWAKIWYCRRESIIKRREIQIAMSPPFVLTIYKSVICLIQHHIWLKYYLEPTLRPLFEEQSMLSDHGSLCLENQLSDQAELREHGEYLFKSTQIWKIMTFFLRQRFDIKQDNNSGLKKSKSS